MWCRKCPVPTRIPALPGRYVAFRGEVWSDVTERVLTNPAHPETAYGEFKSTNLEIASMYFLFTLLRGTRKPLTGQSCARTCPTAFDITSHRFSDICEAR